MRLRLTSFRKLLDTCVTIFGDEQAEFKITDDVLHVTVRTNADPRTCRRKLFNFISKDIANHLVLTILPKAKPVPDLDGPDLSMSEVVKLLGVSKPTIYGMISSGQLVSYKIGSRRFISRASIAEVRG